MHICPQGTSTQRLPSWIKPRQFPRHLLKTLTLHPHKPLIFNSGGVSVLVCRLDFKSSDRG